MLFRKSKLKDGRSHKFLVGYQNRDREAAPKVNFRC
jgi:hypothetical protein